MARTIETIKQEITDAWLHNETLQQAYGFTADTQWLSVYSRVSLENIICYIVAAAIWAHEKLFDVHKAEVESYIAQMKPHTLRWYVNKAKAFRIGCSLIDGTDGYDDTGLTDEEIEAMKPVKFAAATEKDGIVFVKVAAESAGEKQQLTPKQAEGLKAYIAEIKDAGVRVDVINEPACLLRATINIHYNPMVFDSNGTNLKSGENTIENAIKNYIGNLPFNGEYRNSALVDALQAVDGVVIPDIYSAEESYDGNSWETIESKATPYSGYYRYDPENFTITYIPYLYAEN